MAPLERVALLALVYRTMLRDRYSDPICLEDDLEAYPDGVSLVGMIGSQMLQSEDWLLVAAMQAPENLPVKVLGDLAAVDQLRAEAVLHAWPQDPRRELADEDWARPYVGRWMLVEEMMRALKPVTWTREAQEDVANALG